MYQRCLRAPPSQKVDITGVVAAEEEDDEIDAKTTDGWHIFGRECPKEEIVFLCQVIILYTVIRGQHLQPDRRARRLDAVDSFA